MKKIEAIIKTANFSGLRDELLIMNQVILDHRNLSTSNVVSKRGGSRVGSTGLQSIPLTKIELVVDDKSAHDIIKVIAQKSGLGAESKSKIYISEMIEAVDMDTMEGHSDKEEVKTKKVAKIKVKESNKARLIPLQKYTLNRISEVYENNKERLQSEFRIKSFSDFVNFCIMGYLPEIEQQLAQELIMYERKF